MPSTEHKNKVLRWIHSIPTTMATMLARGEAGERYCFTSPAACGLHRMIHSHFSLSNASIANGCWLIWTFIHEAYMDENAKGCKNGYSSSECVSFPSVTQAGFHV
eukprot:3233460-Amphidinium_carterae.1